MKRLLCAAAALIVGTASFFAVEWGGKIEIGRAHV